MKRFFSIVLAAMATCVCIGVLAGCQQIGVGAPTGMPQKKTAQVSTPAIAQEGVLRVGVNAQNAPFSTDVDGRIVGIDVDMAAALANELGLSMEIVDVGDDGEQALVDEVVDIIMGMDKTDTAATCWLSDPYLQTAVGLFATSSGAIMPSAEAHPTIEAQESSMSAWEVSNQFGEDALKTVADLKTAFDDLSSGNTLFVASDVIIGSYINRTSNSQAQIIGLLQTPSGYCVGVSASNNDLKMAVSNAVDAIDNNGITAVIEKKWIGTTLDLSKMNLSDAAAKAAGVENTTTDDLSGVGSNAVDPSQGTQNGETADANAAALSPEEASYDYNQNTGYDTSYNEEPSYSGGNDTSYEPEPEPAPAPEPDYSNDGGGTADEGGNEDTGGGEDYSEPASDEGAGQDTDGEEE